MKDFLCEIYTEEIPARILNETVLQFKYNFEKKLKDFRLKYTEIQAFGSPRRLVVFIKDVSERENDISTEIKGPALKISINESGEKLPPYLKFSETNNFNESDIFIKEIRNNKYIFGKKMLKGKDAKEVLREVTLAALKEMHFQKSMRWEEGNFEFIRPIRNILLLFGEEVVDLTFAGVKSNNLSFGLFLDSPTQIEVKNVNDFFPKIKENYIILSYEDRKRIIKQRSSTLALSVGGTPWYTEEFLEEVANMNEYPTPFLCSIKLDTIKLPDCIVSSVIKEHLKSFPLLGIKSKKLIPYFIAVRNGTSDFIDIVRQGYERVAKARILDGDFFFEEDRKIPFEGFVDKLSEVVFIREIGSMKDKADRLMSLSEFLSFELKLDEDESKNLNRACYLSKGDLVTNVVKEFPGLQGIMGGIYSQLWGENLEVSTAISEQYLPTFAGDRLPESYIGKILSLVDKIDTLVASFIAGIEYSSSKDPFGLRRLGSGIVQLMFAINLDKFPLERLVSKLVEILKGDKNKKSEILSFLKDRAVSVLKEKGVRYDVANAVCSLDLDFMPTYQMRSAVIMNHLNDEKLEIISTTYKRINNIIEKVKFNEFNIDEKLLIEEAEDEIFKLIFESKKKLSELLYSRDYEASLSLLYIMGDSVGRFFDNVLVMNENESIRRNRLALLNNLKLIFKDFADFSQLIFDNQPI